MGRDVPFDKDATCDECGCIGAFDFCGDFFCGDCFNELNGYKKIEINTYPMIELIVEKKQNKKKL